ncbi:MAG TPA: DUF2911 domain-containing protein [Longimicrobiales bacterium]
MKRLITLFAALGCAGALQAQEVADSGSFFVRLGTDTIAVERYTRTRLQLVSEAISRTPVLRQMKLTITFKDDGSVSWWEIVNSPVPGIPGQLPVLRQVVTLIGDSANVELWSGGVQRPTRKIAAHPRQVPLITPFYSTYEIAVQRARRLSADTTLTMATIGGPLAYTIKFAAPDSITLLHPQSGTNVLKLDKVGRLTRFNGEGTTFKVMVTRSRPVDVQTYAARFAKSEKARPFGALSPRDTLEVSVGDADVLMIDYSRPSKRGRVIFGGIVPWDQVWRTGANAATQLIVSKPIEVNGKVVPPGKYTLWTVPSRQGWQLIINKQTGQWGTVYDSKLDLVRVPLTVESVAVPVETFTISAADKGGRNGALSFAWDRVRATLPFKVVD